DGVSLKMFIDESVVRMGIVVFGGVFLFFVAFFIFKSTSGKGKVRENPSIAVDPVPESKERPARKNSKKLKDSITLFTRLRNKIAGSSGGKAKPAAGVDDQQTVDESIVIERSSSRMPDLTSLGLQSRNLSSLTEQETLSAGSVEENEALSGKSQPEHEELPGNEIGARNNEVTVPAPPIDTIQVPLEPLPGTEPVVGESEKGVTELDSLPEEIELRQEVPPDEPAIPTQAPPEEEPSATQPAKSNDLFDMFKDEMTEESEATKFAKNLEDIDAHDLLEEAQNLINYLSGYGGK
ncbi:MAG: hypothetical protein V3R96_01170, partial [Dehalococcoidales bacterium]